MLHEKLQVSPGLATLSPPSEQVIIPLLGLANDEQDTNKRKHANHTLLIIMFIYVNYYCTHYAAIIICIHARIYLMSAKYM